MLPNMSGHGGVVQPAGTLTLIKIGRNGFYENTKAFSGFPAGMPLRYKLRSYYYEICMRIRIFFLGMWRAVQGSSVGPLGRLHFTKMTCECGDYKKIHRYRPCPAARFIHLGLVSTKLVTDAAVADIVDDMDNGSGGADISIYNFHGIGTTNTAEAVGDTALAAESTTALNPDNTRATGTRSQPSANQFRSVGTLTADATIAAVEHGLFSTSGTGTGKLFDRSVYSVVNLGVGESVQATYTVTFPSGG